MQHVSEEIYFFLKDHYSPLMPYGKHLDTWKIFMIQWLIA